MQYAEDFKQATNVAEQCVILLGNATVGSALKRWVEWLGQIRHDQNLVQRVARKMGNNLAASAWSAWVDYLEMLSHSRQVRMLSNDIFAIS